MDTGLRSIITALDSCCLHAAALFWDYGELDLRQSSTTVVDNRFVLAAAIATSRWPDLPLLRF